MKRVLAALVLLTTLSGGCVSKVYIQHPGSVNVFSSQVYDALVATDAVIRQTKIDIAKPGTFPDAWIPNIKTSLNRLILTYNSANASYRLYNISATPENQAALQRNLGSMQAATTLLAATKGNGDL